ncbi:MAG TPA: hypothetical protein VF692_09410 [Pyrinomonadaceae bacterium]|jgi:hypothetical protein
MNLLNELENDLALAFLVDKKHTEKIDSKDVRALIAKVKKALQAVSFKNESAEERGLAEKTKSTSSY